MANFEFKKLKDDFIKDAIETGDTAQVAEILRNNQLALQDYTYALAEKQALLKELKQEQDYYHSVVMESMKEMELLELNEIKIGVNAESVEVYDIDLVPEQYIKQKVTYEVDKTAVKKAIQAGLDVNGARTFRKTKVVIK